MEHKPKSVGNEKWIRKKISCNKITIKNIAKKEAFEIEFKHEAILQIFKWQQTKNEQLLFTKRNIKNVKF